MPNRWPQAWCSMNVTTTTESWYAAKLRFIILLETTGSEDAIDSIYLLRSNSFEAAFARALEIGRAAETEHLGGTGERVRWRLKEIVTLDALQAADVDGVEVHCQFTPLSDNERFGFDHVFQPDLSKPDHSGVT
jgi:hypothetical protein